MRLVASVVGSPASAWSAAASRDAASIAARSAEAVVVVFGAPATLWREQALVSAAIERSESEKSVLVCITLVTVRIRIQDDHANGMATGRHKENIYR
jgi:hypothetical protein